MLAPLVCLLLAADVPDAEMVSVYGTRSTVQWQLEAATGLVMDQRLTAGNGGLPGRVEASAGVRFWRPRLVEGGGRPVVLLALRGAYSFFDQRTTWGARVGLGAEIWRFTVMIGSGFGFGWAPGLGLQPAIPLEMSVGYHLGPLSIGLAYSREFQLRGLNDLRTFGLPGDGSLFGAKAIDFTD